MAWSQKRQTALQRRKLGKTLTGKFPSAGLQLGQQTGLSQVSAYNQNNIKPWKISDKEQREETDSWQEASGLPSSPRPATGGSALCRAYPKLAKEDPSLGKIQLDRPGDTPLMALRMTQCFVAKALLFSSPEAFQVLNPAGELFCYSWSTENFHLETKCEWSERSLPPD